MTDTGLLNDDLHKEDFVDPGQQEGVQKKPSDNLKPGDDRFDKIYGKMKHFERQFEVSETSNQELKEAMSGLKAHNQNMTDAMEKISKGIEEQTAAPVGDDPSAKLANLQTDLKKATEDEDLMKVLNIQNEIHEIRFQKLSIPKTEDIVKEVEKTVTGATAKNKDAETLNDWIKENPWYNENEDAQTFADSHGAKIWKDGMDYKEFLDSVGEKTVEIFKLDPESNDLEEEPAAPKKKHAAVESGKPAGGKPKGGKKTLTDADRSMADVFGIPHEDYLKQLQFTDGGAR